MAAGRQRPPGRRHADGVRAADRPGRAGRRVRLCRLSHQPALRLPAGQAHRARPQRRACRRRRDKAYRALSRVPHRGRADQHRFLQTMLRHPDFRAGRAYTRFVERAHRGTCSADRGRPSAAVLRGRRSGAAAGAPVRRVRCLRSARGAAARAGSADGDRSRRPRPLPPCRRRHRRRRTARSPLAAPMQGTIVSIAIAEGAPVRAGPAGAGDGGDEDGARDRAPPAAGIVRALTVAAGDTVFEGQPLVFIQEADIGCDAGERPRRRSTSTTSAPTCRGARRARRCTRDAARPEAVARRRKTGQRTARENIDDLCDPGSLRRIRRAGASPRSGCAHRSRS